MSFTKTFKLFSEYLRNPEYLYQLLEPVLIFGVGIGVFFFAITWITKEKKARVASLIVIAISCLMVLPYSRFRGEAAPIPAPSAQQWEMPEHSQTRQSHQWVYYTMAGVAVLCLVLGTSGKAAVVFGILTIVGGISTMVFGIWLHIKEARILHPNLRKVEPVQTMTDSLHEKVPHKPIHVSWHRIS
jgi:hypothetical protein